MIQCLLEKDDRFVVGWLDVNPTDKGKYISLKLTDVYEDNWLIKEMGTSNHSKKYISDRHNDYKNMKKVTDI